MQLILPETIVAQLTEALEGAHLHEIGGILMGEHVSENVFRVNSISIQRQYGSTFFFRRIIDGILNPLRHFFDATGHNYRKYNYLGEWHSHPSFTLKPSSTDCDTMWEIVEDSDVGANFAILLIVQLEKGSKLAGSVTAFLPKRQTLCGELVRKTVETL